MSKEINDRVKELRLLMQKSQVEFCELLDIKQGSLSDVERKKINVSPKLIEKVIKNLKVSSDWLYTGNGDIFIEKNYKEMYGINVRDSVRTTENQNLQVNKSGDKSISSVRYIRGINNSDGVIVSNLPSGDIPSEKQLNNSINVKKMKLFWDYVRAYEPEFNEAFDTFTVVQKLYIKLGYFIGSEDEKIESLYEKIQNTDIEFLNDSTVINELLTNLELLKKNLNNLKDIKAAIVNSKITDDWQRYVPF